MNDSKMEISENSQEIVTLKRRVTELEQILDSIKNGKVDALIINNKKGESCVFTLEGEDQPYRLLVESMSEGAITLSLEGDIIHCNKRFSQMVNGSIKKLIGKSFYDYIPQDQQDALKELFGKSKFTSGKGEFTLLNSHHENKMVLLSCHNLAFGKVSGISMVATDITQLKKLEQQMAISLKEKEVMLKEIYHRVKNNLQVVSSLLNLQARSIKEDFYKDIFIQSSTRIKAMALVHEMLYQSGNLAQIEIGQYIKNLSEHLAVIYHVDHQRVKLIIDTDSILLSIENAVPCGLIINELISNAYKHALPNKTIGEINVSIKRKSDSFVLIVNDNGLGFPAGFNFEKAESLGIQLIYILSKQLGATVSARSGHGTTISINFPDSLGETI